MKGQGKVPSRRVQCYKRPASFFFLFKRYPLCWSNDCCASQGKFVARKTWSQWVCLTDDLIKNLPAELKNKKKFANGGLNRPGFLLSPSLKKSKWKKILKSIRRGLPLG